jgi:hypothetical protein
MTQYGKAILNLRHPPLTQGKIIYCEHYRGLTGMEKTLLSPIDPDQS